MHRMNLENILSGVPLPTIAINSDEKITFMNSKAEQLIGKGLIGRHLVTGLRQPILLSAIEATFLDMQDRAARYQVNAANRDVIYDVTCTYSEPDHVILFFKDKSELENAIQMRRDFIANVSHELKTPLTALIGFIETLQGSAKEDTKTRNEFLKIMESEAQRMNRLVADLLSLSKVEARERIRPTETIDLKQLLNEIELTLGPLFLNYSVVVNLDFPIEPVNVIGEKDELRQVFTNLIQNAVKYGNDGGRLNVKLSQIKHDQILKGEAIKVSIKDFGQGIDPVHLPRLTERFYRIDNHRSRELGGTGLGLAIVKHIINRHRGRFIIESDIGLGSEFIVFLPVN
ncbi:MAG: two-component sensor histidine kinase [Rhodobacteraceae bacterium]|nr:two-component sensor histidine kinase [Paracoccaceae bacterium]